MSLEPTITLDSLSIAVEIEQAKINGRTEQQCLAIGRRWAEPRSEWLPTQREMNQLLREAARQRTAEFDILLTKAWDELKHHVAPSRVTFFHSPRTTGKSWLGRQWAEECARYSYTAVKPAGHQPDYRIIGIDECNLAGHWQKEVTPLIDAPNSVNYHFLQRFHKVE